MTGINYVLDEHGEKTALLIDLQKLRQTGSNEKDVMEFIEDIEDVLAVELSKTENNYSNWEEAKIRLKAKGVID